MPRVFEFISAILYPCMPLQVAQLWSVYMQHQIEVRSSQVANTADGKACMCHIFVMRLSPIASAV